MSAVINCALVWVKEIVVKQCNIVIVYSAVLTGV